MKKKYPIILLVLLFAGIVAAQIKISDYPNIAIPASNDLFLIASPTLHTNFNIRWSQMQAHLQGTNGLNGVNGTNGINGTNLTFVTAIWPVAGGAQDGTLVTYVSNSLAYVYVSLNGTWHMIGSEALFVAPTNPAPSGYFVATNGTSGGTGAIDDPWDIFTGVSNAVVASGETVWIRGGTYAGGGTPPVIEVHSPTPTNVTYRNYPGERATIDGQITYSVAGTKLWGLEIIRTDTNRTSTVPGSDPADVAWADAVFPNATDGYVINCVVHNNIGNGLSSYVASSPTKLSGNISYGNGWQGPDRGHGHGAYLQGGKTTVGNIFAENGCNGTQEYGSSVAVLTNMTWDQNISFGNSEYVVSSAGSQFYVGGGGLVSGIICRSNSIYNRPWLYGAAYGMILNGQSTATNNTYYVSPSGSGNGLSTNTPMSFTSAQAAAVDGDTIAFMDGVFVKGWTSINRAVRYVAVPGAHPIIDSSFEVDVAGCTFEGLELALFYDRRTTAASTIGTPTFTMNGQTENIVANMTVEAVGYGLFKITVVGSGAFTCQPLEGQTVGTIPLGTPLRYCRVDLSYSAFSFPLIRHGISAYYPVTIRRCFVHDYPGVGIATSENTGGSLIEDCVVANCGWVNQSVRDGHDFYCMNGDPTPSIWRNNIVFGGFAVGGHFYTSLASKFENIYLTNNLFLQSGIATPEAINTTYTYGRIYRDFLIGSDNVLITSNCIMDGNVFSQGAVRTNQGNPQFGRLIAGPGRQTNWVINANHIVDGGELYHVSGTYSTNHVGEGSGVTVNNDGSDALTETANDIQETNVIAWASSNVSKRGYAVAFRPAGATIDIDPTGILSVGDTYSIYHAMRPMTNAVATGTWDGNPISVSLTGLPVEPILGSGVIQSNGTATACSAYTNAIPGPDVYAFIISGTIPTTNSDVYVANNHMVGALYLRNWDYASITNNWLYSEKSEIYENHTTYFGLVQANYPSDYNTFFSTGPVGEFQADSKGTSTYYDFSQWQALGQDTHGVENQVAPSANVVVQYANEYEPGRGHVAIYNWQDLDNVSFVPTFLTNNEPFEVRYSMSMYSNPVVSGTWTGGAITVPMTNLLTEPLLGWSTQPTNPAPRFGAFVILTRGVIPTP